MQKEKAEGTPGKKLLAGIISNVCIFAVIAVLVVNPSGHQYSRGTTGLLIFFVAGVVMVLVEKILCRAPYNAPTFWERFREVALFLGIIFLVGLATVTTRIVFWAVLGVDWFLESETARVVEKSIWLSLATLFMVVRCWRQYQQEYRLWRLKGLY